jgi:hypothetical protein
VRVGWPLAIIAAVVPPVPGFVVYSAETTVAPWCRQLSLGSEPFVGGAGAGGHRRKASNRLRTQRRSTGPACSACSRCSIRSSPSSRPRFAQA